MQLLLDTHVLLWVAYRPDRLPEAARQAVLDETNDLIFSSVSIWEVAIKRGLGRADFTADPAELRHELLSNGYRELPVTGQHAIALMQLPKLHRDPFDRMLLAQAQTEALHLMTSDAEIANYPGSIVRV